jgi:hypothetical protein
MNATQLRAYFVEIETDDLSADDSCDEDEEDGLEKREIVKSSELDEEKEIENYEAVAIISKKIMPEPVLQLQGGRGNRERLFLRHPRSRSFLRGRGSIVGRVALEDANLLSQHAIEIIDNNNESEIFQPNIILGRQNKAKTSDALIWYAAPNKQFDSKDEYDARVFPQLLNIDKIDFFFKSIITPKMIQEIIINTGKRIAQRDLNTIINDKYRVQTTSLVEKKLTLIEIYAFIGVLILLGITKK